MLSIRQAVVEDSALIEHFIRELAIYEKAEHEVVATAATIRASLFAEDASVDAVICEQDGQPIGFAVYFYNYSTWLGKKGLFLEDLYVGAEHRGAGAGKALLQHLAKLAVESGCGRFEWNVLTWNEPAIQFYQSIGAKAQEQWVGYRLSGEELLKMASAVD